LPCLRNYSKRYPVLPQVKTHSKADSLPHLKIHSKRCSLPHLNIYSKPDP
jgi:hypothetical protein